MSRNAKRMAAELADLGYQPEPFAAPESQGAAEGVCFEYRIEDGSRADETVALAIAVHEDEGAWPEVAPHWVYVSPPDRVLVEQVRGANGSVECHRDADDREWMAVSAPPQDFWDQIDTPNGKTMKTYLDRHVRRIWKSR